MGKQVLERGKQVFYLSRRFCRASRRGTFVFFLPACCNLTQDIFPPNCFPPLRRLHCSAALISPHCAATLCLRFSGLICCYFGMAFYFSLCVLSCLSVPPFVLACFFVSYFVLCGPVRRAICDDWNVIVVSMMALLLLRRLFKERPTCSPRTAPTGRQERLTATAACRPG